MSKSIKVLAPVVLAGLISGMAFADAPVHAVMYELTYNKATYEITHAQVIGGYATLDKCKDATSKVMLLGLGGLEKDEQMSMLCVSKDGGVSKVE
jgi:hypothetical protein